MIKKPETKSLLKKASAKVYEDYDSALAAAKQMGSNYIVGLVGPKQGGVLYNKRDGFIVVRTRLGKK
tara:strand:- start:238 stop:438 length:201 start_codon:yes stop_codon:yes gene_type:complete